MFLRRAEEGENPGASGMGTNPRCQFRQGWQDGPHTPMKSAPQQQKQTHNIAIAAATRHTDTALLM